MTAAGALHPRLQVLGQTGHHQAGGAVQHGHVAVRSPLP